MSPAEVRAEMRATRAEWIRQREQERAREIEQEQREREAA